MLNEAINEQTSYEQPEEAVTKQAVVVATAYESRGGFYPGFVLIRNGHQTTRTSQEPVQGDGQLLAELRSVIMGLEEAVEQSVDQVEIWTSCFPVVPMLSQRQNKNGGYGEAIALYDMLAEEFDDEPVLICKKDPALFSFIRFILQGQVEMVRLMRQMKNSKDTNNEEQN